MLSNVFLVLSYEIFAENAISSEDFDQKELPNKRGNLKSSYAEVPTYHSNDSESEGKIM